MPKSKKAMEYRVYWLEQKLKHQKVSEHRHSNRTLIRTMPAGSAKDLMHLNNEFHQANEHAAGLRKVTEELNKDTITLNERTERLHEVTTDKIDAVEKANRQTIRIQERGRLINKEALRATALTQSTNKNCREVAESAQQRIDEVEHLSTLTRAQRIATDKLNKRTRDLNQHAIKATAASLTLNRQLTDTTESGLHLNQKSAEIQAELDQLKAELRELGENSEALNQMNTQQLEQLAEADQLCHEVITEAKHLNEVGETKITESETATHRAYQVAEACETATERSSEQQQSFEAAFKVSEQSLATLSSDLQRQVSELLTSSSQQLEAYQANQNEGFHRAKEKHAADLADMLDNKIKVHAEEMKEQTAYANTVLQEHVESSTSAHRSQQESARVELQAMTAQSRKSVSKGIEGMKQAVADQMQKSALRIASMTEKADDNLLSTEACREATEQLAAETRAIRSVTHDLNSETLNLNVEARAAIEKVDATITEVNNVRCKMFRETRDLQIQAETLNAAAEKHNQDLETLNRQSLEIQSDSIQTQSLSQEINHHSLGLNDETRRLQAEFIEFQSTNRTLHAQLANLKQHLLELNNRSEQQLHDSRKINSQSEQTTEELQQLGQATSRLNAEVEATLESASTRVAQLEVQRIESQTLLEQTLILSKTLETTRDSMLTQQTEAESVTSLANQSLQAMGDAQSRLTAITDETQAINHTALERIHTIEKTTQTSQDLNSQSQAVHAEMRQAVAESRQVNDEFMRGLEALTQRGSATDERSQQALTQTEYLQQEIQDILNLKHGIDGFQRSVQACETQLDTVLNDVERCQSRSTSHEQLIKQYQQRLDVYQNDTRANLESFAQLERKVKSNEALLQSNEVKFEDGEIERERLQQELRIEIQRQSTKLQQKLILQQDQIDRTGRELRQTAEKIAEDIVERTAAELRTELRLQLDQQEQQKRTTANALQQTESDIRSLSIEMTEIKYSLSEEIRALRLETAAVKQQHAQLQKDHNQITDTADSQVKQHAFELDTLKHQVENYRRLMDTQIDDPSQEQLQHRIKQLENSLKQQHRLLKQQEQKAAPEPDSRIGELQATVNDLSQSMQDVVTRNSGLKLSLREAKSTNQQLELANQRLQVSLQGRQNELDHCLQRIQRLESRDSTFEGVVSSLKTRDIDTQQTLQQMRSAVQDSTQTMRETQKTLETLNKSGKKEWLSPKQAVMSSVFALAVTGMGFFGYEEVNASSASSAELSPIVTAIQYQQPQASVQQMHGTPATTKLDNSIQALKKANASIVELGEFAWPVNFGIVDPTTIGYENHRQGINIEGELGDPVVAVNDGTVIYADNKIRGYGNMIVIKHDDDLVSVYANNQFNYVAEGSEVRRGQLIGDIGQLFNTDSAGLYFEIRRDGQPTDPLNYLQEQAPSRLDLLSAL